ncbi:hypothetical protein [Halobacillus litoralis]|uniref:Uncharacterized protein n=1 Tax=Halobacillus faecis TaxID=360184 RepID=A0A511WWF6_9BACI|nr:hypothetical protein [Halobacillus litoralis]GEN53722.1 hypothetical protein HFA01_19840 [Halobacillus faecis]
MFELATATSATIAGATWFWLFVPMPILIILSIITLFTERSE